MHNYSIPGPGIFRSSINPDGGIRDYGTAQIHDLSQVMGYP